ncbi:MAG: hypothetical protein AAF108_02070 [Planctomycetota bacterium]
MLRITQEAGDQTFKAVNCGKASQLIPTGPGNMPEPLNAGQRGVFGKWVESKYVAMPLATDYIVFRTECVKSHRMGPNFFFSNSSAITHHAAG